MSWEHEVEIHGFQEEFSIIALKVLLRILTHREILENIMELSGTKGYHRAYYRMNRERRKERDEARIKRKFGMTKYEWEREYYRKHKKKIDGQRHKSQRRLRESAKHEGLWE